MNKSWRFIFEEQVAPGEHLASLEAIWRGLDEGESPPTLVIRTLQPCLLIGASQVLEDSVNLDQCRKKGISVFRRPSEGGTVFLDSGSLVFSLMFRSGDLPSLNEDVSLETWSMPVFDLLEIFSIPGTFHSPNDIHIAGRKICGTTLTRFYDVLSFSGTLLISSDLTRYESCFPVPASAKILPLSRRLITLSQALTRPPGLSEIVHLLAEAFAGFLKKSFNVGSLTSKEQAMAADLRRQKFQPCGSLIEGAE